MDLLSNSFHLILIILGFGVLIFVHELGHFLTAKWAGIRVEAFAVGMGPVICAYRKGIGLRFGSTWPALLERVREHYKSGGIAVDLEGGSEETRRRLMYRAMDALGIGETEYSLRWFPIGGFVKMLGQEDANPNAVSDDPRSYTRCPVGKRMIVVSAGVVANVLLAMALFVIAFMVGVKFEAPVVGDVRPPLPAATAKPENAAALGISDAGLKPGDEITHIDGEPVKTFADIQIASAMGRPGVPLRMIVRRQGIEQPLEFVLTPIKDELSGLLSIGIEPGASTLLRTDAPDIVNEVLEQTGLARAGVKTGMRMTQLDGKPVRTYGEVARAVNSSGGRALSTQWSAVDADGQPIGAAITAELSVEPLFQTMVYKDSPGDEPSMDIGLFGFSPLTRIASILKGSANTGLLEVGDVVVRVGSLDFPRLEQFRNEVSKHKGGELRLVVLHSDGLRHPVTAIVNREGRLQVSVMPAYELMTIAQPLLERLERDSKGEYTVPVTTPAAVLNLMPGTTILSADGKHVSTWAEFRSALRAATQAARDANAGASVALVIAHPTPGEPHEIVSLALSAEDVASLHGLGWTTRLAADLFEPIYVTRTADGNPVSAITMGFEETHKLIMLTYLTIDRLFRGSVGVKQLHGPVGIVHIGTKVADRGFTYLVFFLAMISVNLAVINFLPMPIVDGGLFLFLIYEKFKGRPPPLAFQNAATIAGLCLIGTIFLITFYNDIMRLIS